MEAVLNTISGNATQPMRAMVRDEGSRGGERYARDEGGHREAVSTAVSGWFEVESVEMQVHFWGHVVSGDVMPTEESRMETMCGWPAPCCACQGRSILYGPLWLLSEVCETFYENSNSLHAFSKKNC